MAEHSINNLMDRRRHPKATLLRATARISQRARCEPQVVYDHHGHDEDHNQHASSYHVGQRQVDTAQQAAAHRPDEHRRACHHRTPREHAVQSAREPPLA